jgi:hypothetical protein
VCLTFQNSHVTDHYSASNKIFQNKTKFSLEPLQKHYRLGETHRTAGRFRGRLKETEGWNRTQYTSGIWFVIFILQHSRRRCHWPKAKLSTLINRCVQSVVGNFPRSFLASGASLLTLQRLISVGAVNNTGTADVHNTHSGYPPTTAAVPLKYMFISRNSNSARWAILELQ